MKVNMNKTKVIISGKAARGYTILEDSHVLFLVEVLVGTH